MKKPVLALVALAASQTTIAQNPSKSAPPCVAPEHNQFDFWVGEWDVYPNGANQLVAHSKIEKLYSNCAIREN